MEQTGRLDLLKDPSDNARVLVVYNGRRILSVGWRGADRIARAFRFAASAAEQYANTGVAGTFDEHALRANEPLSVTLDQHDPSRVLMLVAGRALGSMSSAIAAEVGKSFIRAARGSEEYAAANKLIEQQALLTRTGAPFGLSDDPKIQDAAYRDAQWDSRARKTIPLRAPPSPRRCGRPTITLSRCIGAH